MLDKQLFLCGKLLMLLLWKWLFVFLFHALWYLVAAGLPLGSSLWDSSGSRSASGFHSLLLLWLEVYL